MNKGNGRRYHDWDENEQPGTYDEQLDTYDDQLDTYDLDTFDDDQIGIYEDEPEFVPRRRPAATRSRSRRRPKPRQRRVWPWLLVGCLGGVILLVVGAALVVFIAIRTVTNGTGSLGSITGNTNATTYTQPIPPQQVPLTSIAQLTVQDLVGNVTITVDSGVATPTISGVKRVKAASSDAANTAYNTMSVEVQPAGTPANTLAVIATVPNSGGILGNHNDAIDLTITLPPASVASATSVATPTQVLGTTPVPASITSPLALSLTMTIGDATINGLSGILGIKDGIGSITVNNGTLSDGSHLETGTGNVTVAGNLDLTPATGNTTPRYKLQSETGTINVTLPAATNIILDANTNDGNISSDFPINVQTTSGAANYYGPLIANSAQGQPVAVLTLNVSTGQVAVHKA